MQTPTRREFLETGSAAVAAVAWAGNSFAVEQKEILNVGLIGCGGMGNNHLRLLVNRKEIRLSYVCDADATRLAAAKETVEKAGLKSPQGVKDLRQILDDKTIDAVWIATPDHWHAPATILACEAGKHVYVEKPCSHNIREGRLMLDAARKHKRIVQVGTQARSTALCMQAVKLLREGVIGDVLVAKAWNSQLRRNIGHQQPSAPPANLDFDTWLGPTPKREYQSNLLHGIWRFWYDYGAGDMGNDGVHELDIARWGLGVTTHPSTIAGLGSKFFFDDDQQFPDNQYCVFEWPGDGKVGNKRQLIYEQRDWSPYFQEGYENGNAFYGTKGVMILGKGGGFQIIGPRNKPGQTMSGSPDLPAHHQDFLDCIRTSSRPHADIEEGHLSAALCHLGNSACRLSKTIHFDPKREQILGDEEAQKLVRRTYRDSHWAIPKGV